ncbi:hypothetical protein [Eisenibacter elegans]|uniref:hypothetical protein n=1 Tax=Eisenibacter elegans TaxID=997 RepID=UPI00047D24CE|nr:hypothetical protein [Eisenibacter elegans]
MLPIRTRLVLLFSLLVTLLLASFALVLNYSASQTRAQTFFETDIAVATLQKVCSNNRQVIHVVG